MFKHWKIAYKVMALPVLATMALVVILVVTPRAVTQNEDLLDRIETGFFPASELTRDLVEDLAAIQRGLQDAASAHEVEFLTDTDAIRDRFVADLRNAAENPVLAQSVDLAELERRFEAYYELARDTTLRFMQEEVGEGVSTAIESMQREYNVVRRMVESAREAGGQQMTEAFTTARENQQTASGILTFVSLFSAVSTLVLLVLSVLLTRGLARPVRQALDAANRLAEGDMQVEIEVSSRDEIGQLLDAMSRMVAYLREMATTAKSISGGDLTVDVSPRSPEDTLGIAFQSMVGQLSETIALVRTGVQTLSTASDQVSATSQGLSQGTSEQAASVEEASASLEEMTASITENANNSKQMERIALDGTKTAEETGFAVRETVEAMSSIAERISIVEEISYQTNLLALNAAIEAARAGEHGRGFAVVASEVRKLAERSQGAAQDISGLASSSVSVAQRSGGMLDTLVPSTRKTADLVQEVAAASEQQSAGVGQINGAMRRVDEVAQRNASAAEELSSTAQEMSGQALRLRHQMSFFQLNGGPSIEPEPAGVPQSLGVPELPAPYHSGPIGAAFHDQTEAPDGGEAGAEPDEDFERF